MSSRSHKNARPYLGFVVNHNGKFSIDKRKKLNSLLANEIILYELQMFLSKHFSNGCQHCLLDVGAGTRPYWPVYKDYFSKCVSFDASFSPHNTTSVDLFANANLLPFQEKVFDCIICTEVLEHVPNPVAVLNEINRVLKPGGRVFLTTPFLVALHEMPYDFYRYTPSALQWMAKQSNLVVETIITKGDFFALAMYVILYPVKKIWNYFSKALGIQLYHPLNPLVFCTIILPQMLYFAWWKKAVHSQRNSITSKIYRKLDYITLGYVTTLEKSL
jgi:SAM-dependent methyltransferase